MSWISANITTFIGDEDAEHYYCRFTMVGTVSKNSCSSYGGEDLTRVIDTQEEVNHLNKKDDYLGWHIGTETIRFKSIEQIHCNLIKQFPNDNIISYYESQPFKEMLYIKDGEDLGYEGLGDIWLSTPNSCWRNLLPKDLSEVKVKCENCGKEYSLEDVSFETTAGWDNRALIEFYKNIGDLEIDFCCNRFNLVWNQIL